MAEGKSWSDIGVVDFREIVCGALRTLSQDVRLISDFQKLDEVVGTLTTLRTKLDNLEDLSVLGKLKDEFLEFIQAFGEQAIL